MIGLSSLKMEDVIVTQSITGEQKLRYSVLFLLLFIGGVTMELAQPMIAAGHKGHNHPLLVADALFFLFIAIFTVVHCHGINKRIDSHNFIERYFLLAVPVSIKTIFLGCILYTGMGFGLPALLGPVKSRSLTLFPTVAIAEFLMSIYFYRALVSSFRRFRGSYILIRGERHTPHTAGT